MSAEDTSAPDPAQWVVGFHALPDDVREGGTYAGADVVRVDPVLAFAVVLVDDPDAFRDRAREDARVRYVEPDQPVEAFLTPDDTYYATYQYGPPQIDAPAAWDVTLGETSINVCVADTGVRYSHEDLTGPRWSGGYDFVNGDSDPWDDHGHGTFTTGIAAATTNNAKGIAGIAQSTFTHVKVLSGSGSGSQSGVASGIRWCADNGAHIISMSLGASSGTSTLANAVSYAAGKNVLQVAATGNDGCSNCVAYPAAYSEVIAVGCTTSSKGICSFSNQGPQVELVAPGYEIASLWKSSDSYYVLASGTSASAPHVSGAAALVMATRPGASANDIRALLQEHAEDRGSTGRDSTYGFGIVQVFPAMRLENAAPTLEEFACSPNPASVGRDVTCTLLAADDSAGVHYTIAWGDNTTTRVPESGTVLPGVRQSVQHAWHAEGTFTLTATATDAETEPQNPLSSAPRTLDLAVQTCVEVRSNHIFAPGAGYANFAGATAHWENNIGSECEGQPYSLTGNGMNEFDVCWYQDGTLLTCHRELGEHWGIVPAGANRALVTLVAGVSATYTLHIDSNHDVDPDPEPPAPGGDPVTLRADDGSREDIVVIDYSDDTAVKRYYVSTEYTNRIEHATLQIHGRAARCGSVPASSIHVYVNYVRVDTIRPCALFSDTEYSWQNVTLPAWALVPGVDNRFSFGKSGSYDWTSNNLWIGIDTDTDEGRSTIRSNGNVKSGELMVRLVLHVR